MNMNNEADKFLVSIDVLESIRNRLHQVHLSLRKLMDQINHHNRNPTKVKFPSYGQIHSQLQVLLTQLQIIASNLEKNANLLKTTNVYPLPVFPTSQQEGLITTLLRKKPLPEVTDWIDEAISICESSNISLQKEDELSQWCSSKMEELKEEFQFYGFHTEEEVAFLKTEEGIIGGETRNREEKRQENYARKITDGGKQAMSPNQILKFTCTGII